MTTNYNPDPDVIIPQLAVIEREITGVERAYDSPPTSLNSNDMPCFINLPGPMTEDWSNAGEDEFGIEGIEVRRYDCILVIAPISSGIPGEKYTEATTFLAPVRTKFAGYPFLKGERVYQTEFKGDSGVVTDINYGGLQYFGIRFAVLVAGKVRVNYVE